MRMGFVFLLLALACCASLMVGEVMLGPKALWQGLLTGEGPGALTLKLIRGPRVAVAVGAGAVLGMAGAIFQTLLRNPLAAPDVMGFNAGAGLAVITAIWAGVALPMPLVAALGGLGAGALVALFSWRPGLHTPTLTLILVGLGVGFATGAASSFLMLGLPSEQAGEAQRWLAGSLAARTWSHAAQVWGIGAILLLLFAGQSVALGLLELGRELAAGLGLRVDAARWGIVTTGVLLAATGVAVAGPVPFVALMALPLGVALTGAQRPAARYVAAAVAGALVMVLADLAARAALPGIQLPIGVMTGILGAPYLLWRLSREMERGEL